MVRVYAVALPGVKRFALAVPLLKYLVLHTDRAPRGVVRALKRVWSSREVDRTVAVSARLGEPSSFKMYLLVEGTGIVIDVCWLEVDDTPAVRTVSARRLRQALLRLGGENAVKLGKPTTVSSYVKQDTSFLVAFYVSNRKIAYVDVKEARESRDEMYGDQVRYVIKAGIAAILIG